uniref:Uncharacterized protein n=1 Tax=Chromera velia CCMP2878 TaxID=1169474 RepID=A0A0G4F2Z8_9ALVE|eukprot:Cvel_14761.t1-p1 / transcript=Cvel_14761.t1 / gene=Cvel_14761 / organism=Chromera_velia_CCMP2878 / gene_product=Putative ankyrin repeat protein RF_0381, putative / transcript_product=Putative ankyrin repeat protein RF_0381, putative / location=Cvel_scaffold1062:53269-54767(+) / protein_length=430 / sequence_SO=supercontig / SO=protein_coding / is_pseudo=false
MGSCVGKNSRESRVVSQARTAPSTPIWSSRNASREFETVVTREWGVPQSARMSVNPSPSPSEGGRSGIGSGSKSLQMDLAPLFRRPVGRVIRSFRPVTAESLRAALEAFIMRGETDDLCLLLFVGADIDGFVDGQTALMRAIDARSSSAVRVLVEAGANLELQCVGGALGGETALHLACRTEQPEVGKFLLSMGANCNAETAEGWRALHLAAFSGWLGLVRSLLLHGAELHAKSFYGDTALHRSVFGGQRAVTELLLDRGARVNEKGENDTTPLFYTVLPRAGGQELTDNRDIAELLLSRGADANAKESVRGRTVLHEAACWGSADVVQALLVKGGADVHATSKCGCTALHYSAFRVKLMNECGVDMKKKLEIAKTLVSHGVDVKAVDNLGMSASRVAEMYLAADSPIRTFLAEVTQGQSAPLSGKAVAT